MSKASKTPQPQTVESLQLAQAKKDNRHNLLVAIIVTFMFSATAGLTGGYFAAIGIITDSQSKAIQVVSQLKQ